MQVNVGRGGAANNLALQQAFENQCDFLLVQEPWIGTNPDRQLSKRHNAYQAYAPEKAWTDRPRVITYAQCGSNAPRIEKQQDLLGTSCLDTLVVEITSGNMPEPIYIINIYNAPQGCIREGSAVRNIISSPMLMQKRSIIGGDFNLHHRDWDCITANPTPQAREFSDWVINSGREYGLPPGTIPHH